MEMATQLNEKPFKCPKCPYRTKCKRHVKRHFKNLHLGKSDSSRPFPCPSSGCKYAAKQKSDLTKHSKIHSDETPKFFCSFADCNFSTKHKQSLANHTLIHNGAKPWVCHFESCAYAAARRIQVVLHSRIHTKEKPYKCLEPNCEYSTAQSSHLQRHQLIHEPKEGEEHPSFKCPLCEHTSNQKENLTAHIKRHTLEKFFKCDEPNCNFEAKRKTEIKDHKMVHSDEKPYVCKFQSCEYRCKYKSNLVVHVKIHSEERRYKCELCSFRGKARSTVTSHLKLVHSDPDFQPFKCTEPNCDFTSKTKGNLQQHLLIHKKN